MGLDVARVSGEVDEELICPICSGVLEDPVQVHSNKKKTHFHRRFSSKMTFFQAPECEHAFCRGCITPWVTANPTCPVDRRGVTPSQLKAVPRILR